VAVPWHGFHHGLEVPSDDEDVRGAWDDVHGFRECVGKHALGGFRVGGCPPLGVDEVCAVGARAEDGDGGAVRSSFHIGQRGEMKTGGSSGVAGVQRVQSSIFMGVVRGTSATTSLWLWA
jgi:hypothetical protein